MGKSHSSLMSILLAAFVVANEPSQTHAATLSHPENLKFSHKLDCITLEKVSNTYTPADISVAIKKCIKRDKFEQAIQLFFVYSVYGCFDQERMVDASARSAIGALNLEIFLNMSVLQREGISQAAQKLEDTSGSLFNVTCGLVKKLGPPNYEPLYMAAHGLRSFRFIGEEAEYLSPLELSELIKEVNVARLWEESLHQVNRCPR